MKDITIIENKDKLMLREIQELLFDVSKIKSLDKDRIEKRANELLDKMYDLEVYLKV